MLTGRRTVRVREGEVMANGRVNKPYPPRWAMIYMLVIVLCLIVWVILDVMHGGPPWERPW